VGEAGVVVERAAGYQHVGAGCDGARAVRGEAVVDFDAHVEVAFVERAAHGGDLRPMVRCGA
jgi:hypothetical protein